MNISEIAKGMPEDLRSDLGAWLLRSFREFANEMDLLHGELVAQADATARFESGFSQHVRHHSQALAGYDLLRPESRN